MKTLYLHPLKGAHGAPPGAVGMSGKPTPDADKDVCGLVAIDPSGMICPPDEAESIAAELCRRWNNYASLMEVVEIITADVVEVDDLDRAADLARKIKSGGTTQITTVYEPYPGAFDDLIGSEAAQ